jgi:hypothetical protein
MTRRQLKSSQAKQNYLLTQLIYTAQRSYGLSTSLEKLLSVATEHHGISTVREIAELLTSQVEPDTIPDDKLGLSWTFKYSPAKTPDDLDRYRHYLASAQDSATPYNPHSTIDPLSDYDDEERHDTIGEYIEPAGFGVTPRILIDLHISDPSNWAIHYKITTKAKQLTKALYNDGSVDRIEVLTELIYRKLLVQKKGHRVNLSAIARIIALICPRITYKRCFKVLRVLLEGQGHAIVMRHGMHYLADHVLLPYPVDPKLLDHE